MAIRRIVTETRDGRAVLGSDVLITEESFDSIPDFASTIVWGAQGSSGSASAADLPTVLPPRGGSRFLIVNFPPDAVYADPAFDGISAAREQQQRLGDLAATFESDASGMHRTDTLDYAIVLTGSPILELDDGVKVPLSPGDTIVQQATRHAWRNPGPTPARIVFVMLGNDQAVPA